MPMIPVPNNFIRFFLEYEEWKKLWKAFALIQGTGENAGALWYKGTGANPDLASKDLIAMISGGKTIGKLEEQTVHTQTERIKSRGFRNLEKAKQEKRDFESNQPKLKDLF